MFTRSFSQVHAHSSLILFSFFSLVCTFCILLIFVNQSVCTIGLCWSVGRYSALGIPPFELRKATLKDIAPLSVVYTGMVLANSLCLRYIDISFYQVWNTHIDCSVYYIGYVHRDWNNWQSSCIHGESNKCNQCNIFLIMGSCICFNIADIVSLLG